MKTFIAFFILLSFKLQAQNVCSEVKTMGIEFPVYKGFYKSQMSRPVTDTSILSETVRNNTSEQIHQLTNGLLIDKIKFKKLYIANEGSELYEPRNAVVDDSGHLVPVKYRLVYDLIVSESVRITFGVDVDRYGNVMYKNELPLLFANEFPAFLNCERAMKLAMKEAKSFSSATFFYDPLTLKFTWSFMETRDKPERKIIMIDAVTSEITVINDRFTPPKILRQ